MKSFKISLFITAIFVLISISCQRSEIIPYDLEKQANMLKGGKPGGSPGYDMEIGDNQMQIYGVWHAGNDYCTWGSKRDMIEFDSKNHWLIDRDGNGTFNPSVNLVVLSFVNPLTLLTKTTVANPLGGIPVGMNQAVVDYFKSKEIRVMLSIGGITYTNDWNTALAKDAAQLGLNAAAVAKALGVGIEIDYEESSNPNLTGLQAFIDAYRSVNSYDETGRNPAARLTIDLAAGDRWLIGICRKATADWLRTDNPVLDYANAMVPARQPSATTATDSWYEHVVGKSQYAPPIPPLAPCKFTGALYISGSNSTPECVDFNSSIQKTNSHFVRSVISKIPKTSSGMLGYMFWAAECPSTRQACAVNCTGGLGKGASYFGIIVPMPPLRQN